MFFCFSFSFVKCNLLRLFGRWEMLRVEWGMLCFSSDQQGFASPFPEFTIREFYCCYQGSSEWQMRHSERVGFCSIIEMHGKLYPIPLYPLVLILKSFKLPPGKKKTELTWFIQYLSICFIISSCCHCIGETNKYMMEIKTWLQQFQGKRERSGGGRKGEREGEGENENEFQNEMMPLGPFCSYSVSDPWGRWRERSTSSGNLTDGLNVGILPEISFRNGWNATCHRVWMRSDRIQGQPGHVQQPPLTNPNPADDAICPGILPQNRAGLLPLIPALLLTTHPLHLSHFTPLWIACNIP